MRNAAFRLSNDGSCWTEEAAALRDKFAVGLLFGLVANIPKMLADIILYTAGFSKFFCFHVTGGVILSPKWLFTPQGYFIGAVLDYIFAGFLGVLGAYAVWLLREQGRHLFLKALGFSIFIWLFLCIMVVEKASMWPLLTDPRHAYQTFIVHQLWGVVFAFLLAKYGRMAIVGGDGWNKT